MFIFTCLRFCHSTSLYEETRDDSVNLEFTVLDLSPRKDGGKWSREFVGLGDLKSFKTIHIYSSEKYKEVFEDKLMAELDWERYHLVVFDLEIIPSSYCVQSLSAETKSFNHRELNQNPALDVTGTQEKVLTLYLSKVMNKENKKVISRYIVLKVPCFSVKTCIKVQLSDKS